MYNLPYTTATNAFEKLNAKEKALFINARLQWATTEMISAEVHIRLTLPKDADEAARERGLNLENICDHYEKDDE